MERDRTMPTFGSPHFFFRSPNFHRMSYEFNGDRNISV